MLTWIPWVWVKWFALAAVLLALGTVVVGYVALRPKPVGPAEAYYERWLALAEKAHGDRLYDGSPLLDDVLEDVHLRVNTTLQEALLPETEALEPYHRENLSRLATDRLREGEWGHPIHTHGARVVKQLRSLID